MKTGTLKLFVAATAFAFTLAACSSSEAPPENHPEPESARLFDATTHTELPQPYVLPTGVTTRVDVHYYGADGADITSELIADHYSSLTFTPATFATVASVSGARFVHDVTVAAAAGATSSLEIGWGHDELADERSFGPYAVTAGPSALPAARAADLQIIQGNSQGEHR
jgi:hypothetical protein